MSSPIVSLQNVTTTYEGAAVPVIHDISLAINPGEFVIIGGPNGAGKTTLLETIAGLLPIVSGTGEICGEHIPGKSSDLHKKLGYVIQNFDFDAYTPFTVEEVMLMARFGLLGLFHRPKAEDHKAVDAALAEVGICDLRKQHIGKLSGGQQQKVLIAHNLAKEPSVLLLDEPFSNLDISSRELVCNVLCRVADTGVTIIIVSHAFDALPKRDIRVIVMNEGRITVNKIVSPDAVLDTVRTESTHA